MNTIGCILQVLTSFFMIGMAALGYYVVSVNLDRRADKFDYAYGVLSGLIGFVLYGMFGFEFGWQAHVIQDITYWVIFSIIFATLGQAVVMEFEAHQSLVKWCEKGLQKITRQASD